MDKAGYFSFCTANALTSPAALLARTLIVEVTRNMPRVFGESMVHISEVDAVVENHVPLLQMAPPEAREQDAVIGRRIAEIVPDHAVLQLGIGGLPNAICRFWRTTKDLGIHTELLGRARRT
jgi:itaconate CoA-transferase